MNYDPYRAESHIRQLCAQHNIERWVCDDPRDGMASAIDNKIKIPAHMNNEANYWCSMHEIGHIMRRHVNPPNRYDLTREEAEAWEWAVSNSLFRETELSRDVIKFCIGTYAMAPQLLKPDTSHSFWRFLRYGTLNPEFAP